jgi:hypothetical protein
MTSSSPEIFCDWLDVTFSPSDAPFPALNRLLLNAGFEVESSDRSSFAYVHPSAPRGVLLMGPSRGTFRVSASGGICCALRTLKLWDSYLGELATSPHKISRLDAAMDLAIDGADYVQRMIDRFPSGQVNLSRKAMPTTTMLAVRPSDGRNTGTFYVGHRSKARFTGRVYDKAWEALGKRGEVLPPRTRIEVTAKGADAGATLRDAAMPAALFWHIAAPAFITAPKDAPVWTPNTDCHWVAPNRDFDPAQILRRRVESCAFIDAMAILADDLGPEGRTYLLHLLHARIDAAASPAGLVPSDTSSAA